MLKKFGGLKQLAVLALFGAVWFFRDWAATEFDQEARDAQQVLSEKLEHQVRQEQNSNQREVIELLSRIELEQRKNSPDVTEEEIEAAEAKLWSRQVGDSGRALSEDVAAFSDLLSRVANNPKKAEHEKIATAAKSVADRMDKLKDVTDLAEGPQSAEQEAVLDSLETLEDDWIDASEKLGQAWVQLEEAAQADQEEASETADTSRAVAWIGTLLSALLVGDWSKALRMLTPGADAENTPPSGGGTAV